MRYASSMESPSYASVSGGTGRCVRSASYRMFAASAIVTEPSDASTRVTSKVRECRPRPATPLGGLLPPGAPLVQRGDLASNAKGGACRLDRATGRIAALHKDGHEAIAQKLVNGTALGNDAACDRAEVLVQDLYHLLRRNGLCQ